MKIMAIGAHFDDVELGVGGTLLKHQQKGDEIVIVVATKSDYRAPNGHQRKAKDALNEGKRSALRLGAKLVYLNNKTLLLQANADFVFALQQIITDEKPDVIYTHFIHDQHTDHQAVAKATLIGGREVDKILFYRSNFYKTLDAFNENVVVDITPFIEAKKELIALFKSEKEKISRWQNLFEAKARADGLTYGVDYAETFMLFWDKGHLK